jgi:hypothetical protein
MTAIITQKMTTDCLETLRIGLLGKLHQKLNGCDIDGMQQGSFASFLQMIQQQMIGQFQNG